MPTRVTKPAATKIGRLKRYVVYLSHTKARGFFIKVVHGTRARPHRVLKITRAARTALGKRTISVGLRGKAFTARILKPKPATLRAKALKLAAKQVGTKESPPGTNRQKFGAWYGLNGEPWCAIFVSWVLSHVGRPFRYSYVPDVVVDAQMRKNGLSVIPFSQVPAALKAGHVVLAAYDWPGISPGLADHIGIVVEAVGPTTFHTIEGNTSASDSGNQSNGGEVCRKVRTTADVQAFIKVS